MLMPEIHILKSEFVQSNANVEKFIKKRFKIDAKIKEEPKNPFLENTEDVNEDDLNEALNVINHIDSDILDQKKYNLVLAETEAGKICFFNRITEFNIFENEQRLKKMF